MTRRALLTGDGRRFEPVRRRRRGMRGGHGAAIVRRDDRRHGAKRRDYSFAGIEPAGLARSLVVENQRDVVEVGIRGAVTQLVPAQEGALEIAVGTGIAAVGS